jgi:hypothetical protein
MSTISVIRGDSRTLLVRVRKSDGSAPDLAGYAFRLTIKRRDTDVEVFADIRGHVVEGGVVFTLAPSLTETMDPTQYAYDIEMANGDRSVVHTLVLGFISVTRDVGGPV